MEGVFFQSFLKISDIKTIVFLAILVALFFLIHILYHKKHMDFAVVVMIGTGLGLVLDLAIQFGAGCPDGGCIRLRDHHMVCNGGQRLYQSH